jgi:hypothetical protein
MRGDEYDEREITIQLNNMFRGSDMIELTPAEYHEMIADLYFLRFVDVCRHEGTFIRVPVLGRPYCPADEQRAYELKQQTTAYLLARKHYRLHGPSWAPRLPAIDADIERLERDEDNRICLWGHFAASLRSVTWDLKVHPLWDAYASGVLAYEHAPSEIREDRWLRAEYPPKKLAGIDPDLYWRSPKNIAESWAAHAKMEQFARESDVNKDELRRIVEEDRCRLAAISK